jgi:hypothetical protein
VNSTGKGLVLDLKELQQLEAGIGAKLQTLGINDTKAQLAVFDAGAEGDELGDSAPLGPFPNDALVESEIAKARRGDWGSRRQLGLWWRYLMVYDGILNLLPQAFGPRTLSDKWPRLLADYVAEAFDRGDINTALDLRREPGRRGRDRV